MAVAVTNAVEVVVLQNPPSTVFVRPLTEQNVLGSLILVMGARSAGRIERLTARRWQRHVPLGQVSFIVRRPVNRVGRVPGLNRLSRRVRIDVHDVMWIDQIYSHEPWLALCLQFLRGALEPRHSGVGRKTIIPVSTDWAVNQVAKSEEIRESVLFDRVAVLQQWRVDRLVRRIEGAAEMPLALIGGVIAELPQTMTDRHLLGRHVALPRGLHVIEDARMLDVLTR